MCRCTRETTSGAGNIDLLQKDGRGLVSVMHSDERLDSVDDTARSAMSHLLDALGAEPDRMEAPFWPWEGDGVIYRICYATKKKTTECFFSAAANLHRGSIRTISYVEADDDIVQSAVSLIASVYQDAPDESAAPSE
ncbi:MAG: hypothetical protein AAFU65_00195 [Pseudomonadota bacterium]